MQRALGIRILGAASNLEVAQDLLARARAGEFAEEEGDPVEESPHTRTLAVGAALGLLAAGGGLFWGTSRPRRLRTVHWIGVSLIGLAGVLSLYLLGQAIFWS